MPRPAERRGLRAPTSFGRLRRRGPAICAGAAAALLLYGAPAAQDRAPAAGGDPWPRGAAADPPLACGTPELRARRAASGVDPPWAVRSAVEYPARWRGQPLWFDQQPRLIRADGTGGLAFRSFVVAGDVETLEFERWSIAAGEPVVETWTRTARRTYDSRPLSVFDPVWDEAALWDTIGSRRRGFDSPVVYFGALRVPKREELTDASDEDAGDGEDAFDEAHVALPAAPLNLPESRVQQAGRGVQYASHVVNVVFPGFGNWRLQTANDFAFEIEEVTRKFYEFFPDVYDSIAIVSAEQHPSAQFSAFHWNVRNPIAGLGEMEVFDGSDYFGSDGVLRSVEFYRDAGFTTASTSNHEIGHQWADFWDWSALAGGIERAGWNPASHTPLLFPGETLLGAVLGHRRRVGLAGGGDEGEPSYVIERTPAPSRYHPTTLYRMGLIGPEELPEMVVFEEQGQFAAAPDVGTAVEGEGRAVHFNDVLALHGARSGPVDSSWRRATIVVSRSRPLSAEEMNYWNFFAARHAARSGVTTFGGMPSFHEATGGRAVLDTAVERPDGSRIVNDPPLRVSDVPIDPGEFRIVRLDEPVPGAMTAGERITFAGRVTSTAAADVVEVCVGQVHIDGPPDEDGDGFRTVTACDEVSGYRFSIPLTFDRGRHGLQVQLTTRADEGAEPDRTYSNFITGITVR